MSARQDEGGGSARVDEFLAAARDTVAKVKNCWIVTMGAGGVPNARVVSPIPGVAQDADWTVWFLTSNGSRKAADIRADAWVTLGFQHDADSAYAVLAGRAEIVEGRADLANRWNADWNTVFPAGPSDPDAVFVKVEVERIELWNLAHGVTPAPFGKRAATLKLTAPGQWIRDA
ncbi:MAG TPA: pyridoxamine 5'-phosphate oxidase family protein [Burkholderiaceae bacterium]|nr:pyridoxamine 5'-phosphate oxidase family protein [Burkholderiaceae bacterium]